MISTLDINKLLKLLNAISPFNQAEDWDNVGLMVGDPGQKVRGILLALDPTEVLLAECRIRNCNTVITHHPLIFHPLKNIRTDHPPGRLLATALKHEINVIACHTNLDALVGGVSDILAQRLGLINLQPLQPLHSPQPSQRLQSWSPTASSSSTASTNCPGFGRIGELTNPMAGETFLVKLLDTLDLEAAPVAGPLPTMVNRVAVCGGSGSDFAERARQTSADIYVSAEIKHAVARWAETHDFCVVDVGHYPSENPMIAQLAQLLTSELASAGFHDIPVRISRQQRNPFRLFYRDQIKHPRYDNSDQRSGFSHNPLSHPLTRNHYEAPT